MRQQEQNIGKDKQKSNVQYLKVIILLYGSQQKYILLLRRLMIVRRVVETTKAWDNSHAESWMVDAVLNKFQESRG